MPAPRGDGAARHQDAGKNGSSGTTSSSLAPSRQLRADPAFRRLVEHLHRLGPRPVGEFIIELIEAHGIATDVIERLEEFAELDPAAVGRLEAADWPPLPLEEVAA